MKRLLHFLCVFSLSIAGRSFAGSATWNLNPTSSNWNTAANWTPTTVPNDISDVATFGISNTTSVTCSEFVSLDRIVFDSAASSFTITPPPGQTISFYGQGIVNNSGVVQTFLVPGGDFLYFTTSAVVGPGTRLIALGSDQSGYIIFDSDSSAGQGTFIAEGGNLAYTTGGEIDFRDNATVSDANFTIHGGKVENAYGGVLANISNAAAEIGGSYIVNGGSAAGASGGSAYFSTGSALSVNGHFIVNGGAAPGAYGGALQFNPGAGTIGTGTFTANGGKSGAAFGGQIIWVAYNPADAIYAANGGRENNAPGGLLVFPDVIHLTGKITAFAGANGGAGGSIHFGSSSEEPGTNPTSAQAALIRVFGNGSFDQSDWFLGSHIVGSLEGDGLVRLGSYPLNVGSNNLSTTFSGVMQDGGIAGGSGGSLVKTGKGALVLSGANLYSGGTTVQTGRLMVANKVGSATGTGPVRVNGGALGGVGRVAGPVVVGAATLAPGSGSKIGQFVINKTLTLDAMANFQVGINSTGVTSDQVISRGVTITPGAIITFTDFSTGILPTGTVFVVVENSAVTPITGTFDNLADGSAITVGLNTFEADYEGGDGNDLTLTVVQ